MKKTIIFVLVTAFLSMFCACRNGHSKVYVNLEKETTLIESKILETDNCDDLQLLSFSILGLRSDLENATLERAVSESEANELTQIAERLERLWEQKWNDLGCDAEFNEDDELYSSSDDDYPSM